MIFLEKIKMRSVFLFVGLVVIFFSNTLIDMYIECGRKLFDEMLERDVISWVELLFLILRAGIEKLHMSCLMIFL